MKLLGYFYAEAPCDEQLLRVRAGTVGIPGKLTLFTASVLGGADTPRKVERFWLLDFRPTCVPSKHPRDRYLWHTEMLSKQELENCQVAWLCWDGHPTIQSNFTSHIEPDWDCDIRKLLVAYRLRGRIVQRLSPLVTDRLVLNCWVPPVDDVDQPDNLERTIPINLENFLRREQSMHWGFDV